MLLSSPQGELSLSSSQQKPDQEKKVYCPYCGAELPGRVYYCPKCGSSLADFWITQQDLQAHGGLQEAPRTEAVRRRPTSITLIAAIGMLLGFLSLLMAISMAVARLEVSASEVSQLNQLFHSYGYDVTFTPSEFSYYSLVMAVTLGTGAVIFIALSVGLLRLKKWALYGSVVMMGITAYVFLLYVLEIGQVFLIPLIVDLVLLWLLLSHRSIFRRAQTASHPPGAS